MSNSKNILVAAVIAVLFGIVNSAGCNDSQKSSGTTKTKQITQTRIDTRTAANFQTFVTYTYTDKMTGMEAFRLLVPKGWISQGQITWSANPALPAQARFRFSNPNGDGEFNLFPTQAYFWTNNRLFLRTNPPGSLRFGTLVKNPIDLHTALTKVIIPQARSEVSGIRVIKENEVPELANIARGQSAQGVRSYASGGKMRIEYREGGRLMEEEIYAVVSQFVTDMHGYFINYWYIDYVFSFKAEKGRLDSLAKVFQTMVYSMKVNPKWFAKVANVRVMMAQNTIKGIKAIGSIGNMVALAGSEMRENQMRDWEQRQKANDRVIQNFTDHIRGVERFNDPFAGKEVELPSGYGRAFANNLGEYIVTDSPSYNPSVGSNLHWEELKPAR